MGKVAGIGFIARAECIPNRVCTLAFVSEIDVGVYYRSLIRIVGEIGQRLGMHGGGFTYCIITPG